MEHNYRILIVEDDKEILDGVGIYMKNQGYEVFKAQNGLEGLKILEKEEIHLAIIDIMMPIMDGITMTMKLREHYDFPVIMLSAKSEEIDKVTGLNIGADDYVTKPFIMSVLYAKTMALIKRNQRSVLAGDRMEVSGITLELTAGRAYAGGKEVFLTPKEFALLRCLMQNKNLVMSREQLLVKCWGYDYEGESRAVDTHIKRLREKLGDYAECIKTVIKAGYRLEG